MVKTNRSTLHTVYNIHRFRSNCNYVALRVCYICRIYTAPFLNASDSERSEGRKSRQNSALSHPCKIWVGIGEVSEPIFKAQPRTQSLLSLRCLYKVGLSFSFHQDSSVVPVSLYWSCPCIAHDQKNFSP